MYIWKSRVHDSWIKNDITKEELGSLQLDSVYSNLMQGRRSVLGRRDWPPPILLYASILLKWRRADYSYSSVPNRRVGQNKRAGGKIRRKH